MVWSHNDSWLLSGDHAGYVKYWQSNMNNVQMYEAHHEPIRGLRLGSIAMAMPVTQVWVKSPILRVAVIVGIVQISSLHWGLFLKVSLLGLYLTLSNSCAINRSSRLCRVLPER